MLLNPVLHPVPYVLNKVKVWRISRELDIRNSTYSEVILGLVRSVRGSVVLHPNKVFI